MSHMLDFKKRYTIGACLVMLVLIPIVALRCLFASLTMFKSPTLLTWVVIPALEGQLVLLQWMQKILKRYQ